MMPIATVSLVTANQSCCWLTAGHIGARPKRPSTPRNEPSAARKSCSIGLLSVIITPFGPRRRSARGPHWRPLHRRPQPNPHSAR
jgi:hypothetical protein